MTVKLDITKIIEKKMKIYPTMLYSLMTIVNRHCEFRTAFNNDSELGIYNEMIPSYIIFHKDTETFSIIWTQYTPILEDFCKAYENDLQIYGNNKQFIGKPDIPTNNFNVSMIPWVSFEGFHLNLNKGYNY